MRKFLLIAGFLLIVADISRAQGGHIEGSALRPTASIAGATVRVCTETAGGTPCSPLASIFSDKPLANAKANPFTADSQGNFDFFAATGCYKVQVSGAGFSTYTYTKCVELDPASNNAFTGKNTDSNINSVRFVDGVKFTTIAAAISDLGANPGLVIVPSTYTGAQPTSVPTNISIQTLEVPGWTVYYGNLTPVTPAQESGKFIVWTPGFGGGVVNPTASALPYTASQIQNQFAVNMVTQSPVKIPVGAYIVTQVNGDTTVGQSPKDANAVFGNVITGGLTAVGASDSAVSGEFAVSVNTAGAATLPLAVGTFGHVNQTAAQNITDVRGVQGAISTTAGTITNARSIYGIKPVSSGTGSITNATSGYFDLPTIGTAVNRAFHAEGDSSIGGTLSAPAIRLSRSATGTINLLGGTVDPTGAAGDIFYRSDLNRFRYFDTAWHSIPGLDTADTFTATGDNNGFSFTGGNGVAVTGGSFSATAGNGTSSAQGGQINLTAGNGATTAAGTVNITAGNGTANNLNGGSITLTPGTPNGTGVNGSVKVSTAGTFFFFPSATTFANLGTPANGALIYCSDCTIANPCAGVGTGAMAKRLNGVWVCN